MENLQTNEISLVAERTVSKSLRAGWHMVSGSMWTLLRSTCILQLLTIVCPPLFVLFAAQTDELMHQWRTYGFIPKEKPYLIRKQRVLRSLIACLLVLLYVLIGCGVAVALYSALRLDVWMCACVALLIWLALLPMDMIVMQLSYSDATIKECFASLRKGYRNYSQLLAFHCVVSFAAIVLVALFLLPIGIMALTYADYSASLALGEDVSLPESFKWLVLAAYLFGMYFTLRVSVACKVMHATMWGALASR